MISAICLCNVASNDTTVFRFGLIFCDVCISIQEYGISIFCLQED